MQEIIHEILEYLEAHKNPKTQKQMENKGVAESTYLGVAQKDLKVLYKKYRDQHALALVLYDLDHLDARSLACMICDLEQMDRVQFDDWMDRTDSAWLIDYQLSVTLAGHRDAQSIAQAWIHSAVPKQVEGGFYTYCWLLGNRPDEAFTDDEIRTLLTFVASAEVVTPAMAYFVEIVAVSYLPLHNEAVHLAQERDLAGALRGISKMKERGKLGFKRNYLRC